MLVRAIRCVVVACVLTLGFAAACQAAPLWTRVPTGTTHTIVAVAYPSANEVIFATVRGEIFHQLRSGGFSAASVTPAAGGGFSDLAMASDGRTGLAVGKHGAIYRSTDSGLHWTADAAPPEPVGSCPSPGPAAPLSDDLLSVHFADSSTVFVTGNHGDVLESVDAGATFNELNKSLGACVADPGGAGAFTDTAWTDATRGSLVSDRGGGYFTTANGLLTVTRKTDISAGSDAPRELALERDPRRAWSVAANSLSTDLSRTADGGGAWTTPIYDGAATGLRDVAAAGDTVIAVGDGGDIYTSPNGLAFYRQIAPPPDSTTSWHAVALLDSARAAVAGASGALLLSSRANQAPDTIPPTGVISGPTTLSRFQAGVYLAHVSDNPGGSGVDPASFVWSGIAQATHTGATATFAFSSLGTHVITVTFKDLAGNSNTADTVVRVLVPPPSGTNPTTVSSGDATATIFRKVTVSGRRGRFVPVVVSSKRARRFEVAILTRTGHQQVGIAHTTLERGGSKTIDVGLPSNIRPGDYLTTVRVSALSGHGLGRTIAVAFTIV